MTDITLPPLPAHPEPHTMQWTALELRAITAYGRACQEQALEAAGDDVLRALDLSPEQYRTEGGEVNRGKLRATLLHPEEYLPDGHWLVPSHT